MISWWTLQYHRGFLLTAEASVLEVVPANEAECEWPGSNSFIFFYKKNIIEMNAYDDVG